MGYEIIASTIPAVTGGLFDFVLIGEAEESLLISPATILAKFIRQEGFMSDPADDIAWPLFISYFPDIKTEAGAAYDTTGVKDGRLMAGNVIQDYGIQIKISTAVHNQGWTKIEALTLDLDTVLDGEITIDGEDYIIHNITRSGPPIYIGVEQGTKKRKFFTVNFQVSIKRI